MRALVITAFLVPIEDSTQIGESLTVDARKYAIPGTGNTVTFDLALPGNADIDVILDGLDMDDVARAVRVACS